MGRFMPMTRFLPNAFYIRHPYGMAFLYDDTGSADFFRRLKPYLLNTNRIRDKLEIGIETAKDYHGMGYGALTCSALIDFCLSTGLEPVWSCNSTNIGSRKLAKNWAL